MRSKFVKLLLQEMRVDERIFVLLADLGYNLFDELKQVYPNRCLNVGASEQLMIGMATGLAIEDKIPVCYSITPFLVYRPFEFIRNYMQYEQLPLKLVGSGRDKDYLSAGFTHHSEDVSLILNQLNNIKTYYPNDENNLNQVFHRFLYSNEPSFLSLRK